MVAESVETRVAPSLVESIRRLFDEATFFSEDSAKWLDDHVRACLAEMSNGLSVLEISLAYLDWLSHLAISPGKFAVLQERLLRKLLELGFYSIADTLGLDAKAPVKSIERRFASTHWQKRPFKFFAQSWHISRNYWREATEDVVGARSQSLELVAFVNNQILEALSPANFPLTNPDVIYTTIDERGGNLIRGVAALADDLRRKRTNEPMPGTEKYRVGQDVACTPGKVIFQNRLVELIQYTPQTETVDAEPVFFVPAWIMKYYILDLSPQNSIVRYLVEHGKTVFTLSWKNPGTEDRFLTMDDYLQLGMLEPLEVINSIVPNAPINAAGYCIGGTLLMIAAAHLAGSSSIHFNTITTFAAQGDFSEAGEVRAMLGESIFAQLDSLMKKRGLLETEQMGSAFAALRSSDLIWGPLVERYFLGRENSLSDLMAWNADGTRMPYRMHSEYLRRLYMDNDLAEGRFPVRGRVISLGDIIAPMFVVGTATDHIAPWRSVYKIHRLNGGEVTFALTSGGHNAGIICGPSHPRRRYQVRTRKPGDHYLDPDTWQASTPTHEGSWWSAWLNWLDERSHAGSKPPTMGAPRKGYTVLRAAPGEYVMAR